MTLVRILSKTADYQTKEAFRVIRTNLRFCGSEKKRIVVTSCVPGEGKSSVSVSLALALAEDGARVILVDADLRKSGMLRNIRCKGPARGLSDYLSGQCGLTEIICRTDRENLHLVLSGVFPPNPTELLRTDRFRRMMEQLAEEYDYVLVDTPPLGYVIDAAVIAGSCDGILWVIASREIRKGMALEIKEQIEKCGCPVLGAVLNKTEIRKTGYGSRKYGKYYGKYYGMKEQNNEADDRQSITSGKGEKSGGDGSLSHHSVFKLH